MSTKTTEKPREAGMDQLLNPSQENEGHAQAEGEEVRNAEGLEINQW